MAHRTTLTQERPAKTAKAVKKDSASAPVKAADHQERERVFDDFRRWGYCEAHLDPLGVFQPLKHPDLEERTGQRVIRADDPWIGQPASKPKFGVPSGAVLALQHDEKKGLWVELDIG